MTLPRITNPQTIMFIGLLVVLAPIAYVIGRYAEPTAPAGFIKIMAGISWLTALGILLGLPLGLFFGTLRQTTAGAVSTIPKADTLNELRTELVENQQLFLARKGSVTLVARLGYVTSFWDAAQATGQLAAITSARAVSQISLAYYWLKQANHLEALAYDAKNGGVARDPEFTTAKLISEIRLLDEPIEKAITAALGSVADQA